MYAQSWRDRGLALAWIAAAFLAGSFCSLLPARGADAPGDSTRALVQEALQRETYGLTAEREALLRSAVKQDAEAPQPHWYLGEVRSANGGWERAGKPHDSRAMELVREYRQLRDSKADDAPGQKSLAEWCASKGLKQQARAHWLRSLAHNPQQAEVRQKLNLVRIGQRSYEPFALERMKERAMALKQASDKWQPIFARQALQLTSATEAKRKEAEDEILRVKDPHALPMLQFILGSLGDDEQALVIRACAQSADPLATELLAWQAVELDSARLRKLAAEELVERDLNDYALLLIAEMYTPVVAKAEVIQAPVWGLGLRRSFLREAMDHQQLVVSDTLVRPWLLANGRSKPLVEAQQQSVAATQQALQITEIAVERHNRFTKERNERISEALTTATAEKFGPDPERWWQWWMDLNEWTLLEGKGLAIYYKSDVVDEQLSWRPLWGSCLAAGTPVTTDQGPVEVEKIKIGDLVLARDFETGELAYKPVIRTTVRPKKQLKRITAGKDTFDATGGHLFWVSGQGWTRARELKPGQILHAAGTPVAVANVEEGTFAETYNLVVADFASYFVGEEQILSHDNTPRRPTRVTVPGLEPE